MRKTLADRARRACESAALVLSGARGRGGGSRYALARGQRLALYRQEGPSDTCPACWPPAETPPKDAERELRDRESRMRSALRDNAWRIGSWLAVAPLAVLMGLRAPTVAAVMLTLLPVIAVGAALLYRYRLHSAPARFALYAGTCTFAASVSGIFGPLVLVPGFAAMNTLIFSSQGRRSERPLMLAMGVATVAVPLAMELLGVGPPRCAFEAETIVLLPRVTSSRPRSACSSWAE